MLRVAGLTTSYDGIVALENASLEVGEGQAVAVIGANGAGKTTMLKTICGLLRTSRGTTSFDGVQLTGRSAYAIARQGVLLVPEGRQILGALSVEENLRLGRRAVAGRQAPDINSALDTVFELFPILAERRRQYASQLSGGQQQMLAIGRALMGHPRLLILDEPSLGLSPTMVAQVFETLVRLHKGGLGMLIVEQNARLALEVSDYSYVIERGRIVREGDSHVLAADPVVIDHYLG